jgi:hypothetical protein
MKATMAVVVVVAVLVLPGWAAAAQHGMGGTPSGAAAGAREPSPGAQPGMAPGGMGAGMMGPGMMGMGCPMMGMMPMMQQMMMGGMMDPAAMAMPGPMGGRADPRALGRWLQLRGEVLKAVGEVLLRHGKALAEPQ